MASLTLTTFKGTQKECSNRPITNGQLLFETDQGNNGKLLLDNDGSRIQIGGNYLGTISVTFPASGWSAKAPYTNVVAVNGSTSTYYPLPQIDFSLATSEADKQAIASNAFAIDTYTTTNGYITATANYVKPTIDITVIFRGQ